MFNIHSAAPAKLALAVVASCWLAGPATSFASDAQGDANVYVVTFEDGWLGLPQADWDYAFSLDISRTVGETLAGTMPAWDRGTLSLLRAINRTIPWTGKIPTESDDERVWWQFGDAAFTPRNIRSSAAIFDDRPYASLTYLAGGYYTKVRDTAFYWGILGTQASRILQSGVHRIISNDLPQGWSHQIGDGGSPTFLYQDKFHFPLAQGLNTPRSSMQYTVGWTLGYYTRAVAGLSFEYGSTPEDLVMIGEANPAPLYGSVQRLTDPSRSRGEGFGLWLNYEANLVGYNELLQGAWTGSNDVRFSYGQMRRLVHVASVGVDCGFLLDYLGLSRNVDLYYTLHWKSKELNASLEEVHAWGGLTVAWRFN